MITENYNDFKIEMSSVEALFMEFGVPQSKMAKLFSNDSEKSSKSPKVILNNIGLYIRRLENTFWLGLDDGIPEGYAMKLEREFNEAGIKFHLNGYPNKHIELEDEDSEGNMHELMHGAVSFEYKGRTELEEELINVIDNFILWNTTESDRALAEEYMDNEHVDYNESFKLITEQKLEEK